MGNEPPVFRKVPGNSPLLISIPHNGSHIPAELLDRMTEDGKSSRDTDWFLDRLYDLPESNQATILVANYSRYVIDLNRPRENTSLYPGQTKTGLVPTHCFDGAPIYLDGEPDLEEIEHRVQHYWVPWHRTLESELVRLRNEFGFAVLLDAHSIRSEVPRLFPGVLPDFNIGTNHGESCDPGLTNAVTEVLGKQSACSHVTNGRFVGGYITRHYGTPARNIHAMQIELSQVNYMDEIGLKWDDAMAGRVQPLIREILQAMLRWTESD